MISQSTREHTLTVLSHRGVQGQVRLLEGVHLAALQGTRREVVRVYLLHHLVHDCELQEILEPGALGRGTQLSAMHELRYRVPSTGYRIQVGKKGSNRGGVEVLEGTHAVIANIVCSK